MCCCVIFFFQAEDGIRDSPVTGVQTCALPICFPLTSNGQGKVDIVQGIELNDFAQTKIKITTDELLSEKEAVKDLLG